MAPSATETTTTTGNQVPYRLHLGQYKEVDTVHIDRDAELGKNGGTAAKVSITTIPDTCLISDALF